MTYEECLQLVDAYRDATLLAEKLAGDNRRMFASGCAEAIGDFIASMMAQAWAR